MALKSRKSLLGLRKILSNEKTPDVPPMPRNEPVDVPIVPRKDPVDIPISVLCISRFGLVHNQQLTFYRKTDKKFLIGDRYYYIPRCMQPPETTDLDPAICRVTWVFKKEFASNSTAAKQESFMGTYSIWYKDPGTAAIAKPLAQIGGEFWMMKQAQTEPKPGDTVVWAHIPENMVNELNYDWWFMGVQLPNIDAWSKEMAAVSRGR